MDNENFIILSKFTVEARKVIGAINPARLLKDANYSEIIFERVDASDDTDLILLSLQLRQQLGLLNSGNTEQSPDSAPDQMTTPQLPPGKYLYGARG